MSLDARTLASRRHAARITLRTGALLLVLYAVHQTTRNLVGYSIIDLSSIAQQVFGFSLVPLVWLFIAAAFILSERWLVSWLVPAPRPGCPTCGYSLKNLNSPICPECGTDLPRAR